MGAAGRPVTATGSGAQVLRRVREQGDVSGALEGNRQLALVAGAGPRLATRLDLGSLREVAAEAVNLLVVDLDRLVGTEGADLATASIAVEVVALLGSGGGGWHVAGSPGQKGRSSRSASSGGRLPPPENPPDAPAAAGAPTKPASSSRGRRSRLMTLSAVMSRDVRFWPSWPSNSRVRKRPSTNTRLPLRSCSAARSARSPNTLTRNQSVSSVHSPVCWFLVLWLTATLNWVTGRPVGV